MLQWIGSGRHWCSGGQSTSVVCLGLLILFHQRWLDTVMWQVKTKTGSSLNINSQLVQSCSVEISFSGCIFSSWGWCSEWVCTSTPSQTLTGNMKFSVFHIVSGEQVFLCFVFPFIYKKTLKNICCCWSSSVVVTGVSATDFKTGLKNQLVYVGYNIVKFSCLHLGFKGI